LVRSFKGGSIAEGLYRDIKAQVNSAGGKFTASCYIAFKDDKGALAVGNLQMKGAALQSWMDFRKANRGALLTKAVKITGFTNETNGSVDYKAPTFTLGEITDATNALAMELDSTILQPFLGNYFKRTKADQAETAAPQHLRDEDVMPHQDEEADGGGFMPDDQDIPFARMENY
jgi:hypothetical protein